MKYHSKKKNYIFTSERLGFRNWSLQDAAVFSKINADKEVMEHFPRLLNQQETTNYIYRLMAHYQTHGYNYFASEVLETGEFIGFIGLARQDYNSPFTPATDIGWRLKKAAWGKGYATEGGKRCLEYAFNNLNMGRVVATCPLQNHRSEGVMRRIGMSKQGEFSHPELEGYPKYQRCLWYEIKSPGHWGQLRSSHVGGQAKL